MKPLRKRLKALLIPVATLIYFARPGFLTAKETRALLGQTVIFRCPLSENMTMVSWSFQEDTKIAALRCLRKELFQSFYNHSRIIITNTACNTSNHNMTLQIQPVTLGDDGNYTCEIADPDGVHKVIFSLIVTVPPTVSLTIESKLNDTTIATCIASNGKPAAQITWYSNKKGNSSVSETVHGNKTITIQSRNSITTHRLDEQIICSVNHPAFNGTYNYTIPLHQPTPNNLGLTSIYLLCSCLISGAIVMFLAFITVTYFKRRQKQNSNRFTNFHQENSCLGHPKENYPSMFLFRRMN
ncbi:cell surface glycoprotein CD200 receptor 2-like isoform X2 [Narcine bancroftii]|uniref:cell surface glycoprotein CD200 receptor 2-like isoform X2 n=1 Tax=Narcine bancroftii TaxID=1343680 RepID=UPI00383134FC